MKRFVAPCALAIVMALSVTACTDPYDPGQRAAGGGADGRRRGCRDRRNRRRRPGRLGGWPDRWRGGRGRRRGNHAATAAAAYLSVPAYPPSPAAAPAPTDRRTGRPARPRPAPSLGTGRPASGSRPEPAADFPSRREVTYSASSAKQGIVGPGTGNGPFAQQLAGWTEAVDASGGRAGGPIVALGVGGGAVGAPVLVGQFRHDPVIGAAAGRGIEIPRLDDAGGRIRNDT